MANTHKDNNKIPRRAREVLPGNRKDFSFAQRSLVYALKSCNKNANCIQASALVCCLSHHLRLRMQYNDLLNQRTICGRDCHEREKIICIHTRGL